MAKFNFASIFGNGKNLFRVSKFLLGSVIVTQVNERNETIEIEKHVPLPEVQLARKIVGQHDTSGLQLRLYQYRTCPFCCKVRAFLDYYGFSYEMVEVNPVMRRQIKFSTYKKVPIVVAQGEKNKQLNDSSLIVSVLRTFMWNPNRSLDEIAALYPEVYQTEMVPKDQGLIDRIVNRIPKAKPKEIVSIPNRYFVMVEEEKLSQDFYDRMTEERKWRQWVDDNLVHVLSPNVYRSLEESLESFRWFSAAGNWEENFPQWERFIVIYVGALAMYFISKRLKKRHQLKDDVRESLYDSVKMFLRAKGKDRRFLGGERPNLADLAVFGALNSIEGCGAFQDLLRNTNIEPWYRAMRTAVQSHAGSEEFRISLKKMKK